MGDRERRANDPENPGRSEGEEDDQVEGKIVMEEYYDEGPDYCKVVQHYSLTYTALFIALIVYACIGAAVFKALEYPTEFEIYRQERVDYLDRRNTLISSLWNVTSSYGDNEEDWMSKAILAIHRHDLATGSFVRPAHRRKVKWSFAGALFFSCTVISTIGYGNIAPVTNGGRIFCIIYAVFGIAMLLLVLASIGSLFARGATLTYRLLHLNIQMAKGLAPPPKKEKKLRPVLVPAPGEQGDGADGGQGMPLQNQEDKRPDMDEVIRDIWSNDPEMPPGDIPPMRVMTLKEPSGREEGGSAMKKKPESSRGPTTDEDVGEEQEEQVDIPLSIVLVFALMYVCVLAGLLSVWEEQWNYFEAFYFSFITLTTIGFGDLTPVHQKNLLGCTFFILLGMAIMSMCIALAQEIIMKKVAWISERVGVALIKAKPAS